MTLDDLKQVERETLTAEEAGKYLNSNPQCVREGIRAGVPWGYVLGKARFIIPRRAFIHYHEKGAVINE